MPANLENSAVATGLEEVSFHSNPKERQCQRMLKLLHSCSYLTRQQIMLKILQARLQPYVNHEISDNQTGFRKGRGTRDQIANICWIIEKAREFQKNIYSALLTTPKPLTVCIKVKWKILKEMGNKTSWPASWETCMQVRKQQLELYMGWQTGSKSGKEYIKAVYCHPAYLIYMQSTSWETLGWMILKLVSRLPVKYQ